MKPNDEMKKELALKRTLHPKRKVDNTFDRIFNNSVNEENTHNTRRTLNEKYYSNSHRDTMKDILNGNYKMFANSNKNAHPNSLRIKRNKDVITDKPNYSDFHTVSDQTRLLYNEKFGPNSNIY